jgi:hypothetical protein
MNSQTLGAMYDNLRTSLILKITPISVQEKDVYSGYISNVITPVAGLNILTSLRYESVDFKGGQTGQNVTAAYTQEHGLRSWELFIRLFRIKSLYLEIIKIVSLATDIIFPTPILM